MWGALLALGFTTTIAQVLLVRELVAVFYGNELVLGLILAAWLAWGALGAGLSGRFASCSHQKEGTAPDVGSSDRFTSYSQQGRGGAPATGSSGENGLWFASYSQKSGRVVPGAGLSGRFVSYSQKSGRVVPGAGLSGRFASYSQKREVVPGVGLFGRFVSYSQKRRGVVLGARLSGRFVSYSQKSGRVVPGAGLSGRFASYSQKREVVPGVGLFGRFVSYSQQRGKTSSGTGSSSQFTSCSHQREKTTLTAGGLALLGLLPTLQILLVRALRGILRVPPGALVEFGPMVGAVLLSVAPVCVLAGALFPILARRLAEAGQPAGRAYLWECAGAAIGGALFSFVLIRYLDPFQIAALILMVDLATALRLAPLPLANSPLVLPPLALLLLAFLLLAPSVHRATLRRQWSDMVFAADSPYGRIVIQARDSQRIFYENGLLMFETQGTGPEEVVHPPLLAHPAPRDVLLIGGAAAGNLREVLRHPVAHVTVVESDPLLLRAARLHLLPDEAAILDDPRVTIVLADGRRWVQTTRQTFDGVILDLPEPSTGALNRFYTEEFFREVRAVLKPGGILSLRLPAAENYWSPELARRNGSVYHTLRAVFPNVLALPGDTVHFLASAEPLEADPAVWGERLAERGIPTRWVTAAYIRYLFTTDRFPQVRETLERTAGVRLNRDLAPICYYYDLALWLSRLYPRLRGFFERTDAIRLGWVALALVMPVVLGIVRRRWAIPIAVAGAGMAGMTLEMVILLAFQVRHGSLYAQVSLIVTAYMVGMVLGSQGAASRPWAAQRARRALLILMGALAAGAAVLPFLLGRSFPATVFPLLALLAGGWGGAVFPLALQAEGGDAGRAAGRLYGADLAGGCLGALLGGVFFIPLLGIPQTCGAIALVALAGWIVTFSPPLSRHRR